MKAVAEVGGAVAVIIEVGLLLLLSSHCELGWCSVNSSGPPPLLLRPREIVGVEREDPPTTKSSRGWPLKEGDLLRLIGMVAGTWGRERLD